MIIPATPMAVSWLVEWRVDPKQDTDNYKRTKERQTDEGRCERMWMDEERHGA